MPDQKITISWDEVSSPQVDATVRQQDALVRAQEHYQPHGPPVTPVPIAATARQGTTSIWYSPVFYMAFFGLTGALPCAVLLNIAYWNEQEGDPNGILLYMVFIATGIILACALGVAESVMCRNPREFVKSLGIGSVIGFIAGLIYPLAAGLLMMLVVTTLVGDDPEAESLMFTVVVLMLARAPAWMVMGTIIGSTPGIAMRSLKKTGLGMLGGAIGGLLGGLLFDPLTVVFETGSISRFVGICVVGISAGAAIGMLENVAKTGWLRVTVGLLSGKQFIIYKNPTFMGSSPQCEVYLFKDPQVNPRHASIRTVPGGYELEDLNSSAGTYVNGRRVSSTRLRNGDQVQIGATVFQFQEKARASR